MKKMKLSMKITAGFVMLLCLMLILGGLSIWKMDAVKKVATILITEHIPEVAVSNHIERFSLQTMYAVRGYDHTEQASFLAEGREHLDEVKKYITMAQTQAAASDHLVKLKEASEKATTAAAQYETLLDETVALTRQLESERKEAAAAAQKYMAVCKGFLQDQNRMLQTEVENGSTAFLLDQKDFQAISERAQKISLVNEVIELGHLVITETWKAQARRDPNLMREAEKLFDRINAVLDKLKPITRQEKNLSQIEACRSAAEAYKRNMNAFLDNWLKKEAVGQKRGEAGQRVLLQAKTAAELGMSDMQQGAMQAVSSLKSATAMMAAGLAVAFILGLGAAMWITRSITGPIKRVIEGLHEGSMQVSSASGQLSSSSQSLAEGASEQAAAVEETSSSLEEIAVMTAQNTENALRANKLMKEANEVVHQANSSMDELKSAMAEITEASRETSKIIKTIDEIAFQTNLLALNAAVEAARAGEAGAGFAVVADEVRNLAMRAAGAAKNTEELIEKTVRKIEGGYQLAEKAGAAFIAVAGGASRVGKLVEAIAAASGEQSEGISQVNKAAAEMDKVVQQNAANAEESASAAEELNAQASQMEGFVYELVAMVGTNTLPAAKTERREMEGKPRLSHRTPQPLLSMRDEDF